MPLLSVRNLSHTYANGHRALHNVSFDVDAGEFLVVIGLSGSGKSTLLRCINRLIEPTSGEILVNSHDVTHIKGELLRQHRSSIGMIFQQFNLIARHSVLQNVLYGALGQTSTWKSMTGSFSPEQRKQAATNLAITGIAEKADERADSLSGGQQQRVAIARALMQQPRLLLADEPVASLDPSTSHSVMQYLELVNKSSKTTVICNLHFLSLVRAYASRVIGLRAGELVFDGAPDAITDEWFKSLYGHDAVKVDIQ